MTEPLEKTIDKSNKPVQEEIIETLQMLEGFKRKLHKLLEKVKKQEKQ